MFARQHDTAVDLAQIVVVLLAGIVGPVTRTSKRERRAVPGNGNAVLELILVLRMNEAALLQGARDAFLWRHGRELVRIRAVPCVAAEQHALALLVVVCAR